MDTLMGLLDRDGSDVARRFLIARGLGEDIGYLRGELAGLAQAMRHVTGERSTAVESRWLDAASAPTAVPSARSAIA